MLQSNYSLKTDYKTMVTSDGKDGVNKGNHFTGIYKFENELLLICYNLSGDKYPEAFETKDKPTYFLATFKKE